MLLEGPALLKYVVTGTMNYLVNPISLLNLLMAGWQE
jgi:hypothetical protein